jgi:hypothetical protein
VHGPHLYALQGASSPSARLLAEAASCLD